MKLILSGNPLSYDGWTWNSPHHATAVFSEYGAALYNRKDPHVPKLYEQLYLSLMFNVTMGDGVQIIASRPCLVVKAETNRCLALPLHYYREGSKRWVINPTRTLTHDGAGRRVEPVSLKLTDDGRLESKNKVILKVAQLTYPELGCLSGDKRFAAPYGLICA